MMKRAMPAKMPARPAPTMRKPSSPAPMAYMADGGLVRDAMNKGYGCVGPSGGTGGVRSRQDFHK